MKKPMQTPRNEKKAHSGAGSSQVNRGASEKRAGLAPRFARNVPSDFQPPPPLPQEATRGKPRATPNGYQEPRPEPREQAPDSFAHEEERSTGVSGHAGNT